MRYLLLFLLMFIRAESFIDKSPKEGLWEALEYYNIHHKEIVYAQAILETGNFKSRACIKGNNLFGLGGENYYRYKHWHESVKAYKNKIQSRYRKGENYYSFLKRIKYARDPKYISKLKKIVNEIK